MADRVPQCSDPVHPMKSLQDLALEPLPVVPGKISARNEDDIVSGRKQYLVPAEEFPKDPFGPVAFRGLAETFPNADPQPAVREGVPCHGHRDTRQPDSPSPPVYSLEIGSPVQPFRPGQPLPRPNDQPDSRGGRAPPLGKTCLFCSLFHACSTREQSCSVRKRLGAQAASPFRPAPADQSPTSLGTHPFAESMRSLLFNITWLKGPLHLYSLPFRTGKARTARARRERIPSGLLSAHAVNANS